MVKRKKGVHKVRDSNTGTVWLFPVLFPPRNKFLNVDNEDLLIVDHSTAIGVSNLQEVREVEQSITKDGYLAENIPIHHF
jgi:hypothetical protein